MTRLTAPKLLLGLAIVLLLVVPPLLTSGFQYALTNALIAALFAMAFNLLMGQGGMLSFGHAAYFGIGAFAVLHAMRLVEYGDWNVPTVLLPVFGGLAGLLGGVVAGYFSTMRTGVYFSLVTLALAELLHSLAPHWQGVFGGEAGLSSMRMPSMGFTFGTSIEVYYLTLAWTLGCIALLYRYTRTPFGRLTLALRDNQQRVRYLGYNAHGTKVMVFAISAMLAGVAGGLLALSNETANYSIFSTHISAQAVLHTFVGGSTVFFGPIIGAGIFSLFGYVVGDISRSWLLYQGIIFVLVMLYAPTGIGGLIDWHYRQRRALPWKALQRPYAAMVAGALALGVAVIFAVQSFEHVLADRYQAQVERTGEWEHYALFGLSWDPLSPLTWVPPLVLAVFGLWVIRRATAGVKAIIEDNDLSKMGAS